VVGLPLVAGENQQKASCITLRQCRNVLVLDITAAAAT
jgi:hypothetical protein